MAFEGFGKNTGPIGPPKAQTSFGNFPRTPSSETLPKLGNGQKYIYHDYDAQIAHSATVRGSHVQDLTTTLPFSSDAQILTMRGSRSDLIFSDQGPFVSQQNQSSPLFRNKSPLVPKSTRSPPLAFQNNLHIDGKIPPLAGAQRPSLPPHMRGNSAQSLQSFPFRLPHQRLPTIPTNYDPGRQIPVKHTDQVSKRTRSPPHSPPNVASFEKSALGLRESKRPSTSPSKLRSNAPPDSLAPQSSMSGYGVNVEVDLSKPMNFPVPKRTKFPSVPSSDQVFQYDSNHTDDDIQRETEAKAKRLARFKDDLSQQNVRDDSSIPQKGPSISQYQSVVDRPKFSAEDSVDSTDDFSDGNLLSDYQG